jgi:histidinol-phosphate/aromatic aminotransferase/cobyric acid decarboxylase-like protein
MSTEMRKRGVSIRGGGGYRTREHNMLNNHIRVSIGKQDELEVFISELKDILGRAS